MALLPAGSGLGSSFSKRFKSATSDGTEYDHRALARRQSDVIFQFRLARNANLAANQPIHLRVENGRASFHVFATSI